MRWYFGERTLFCQSWWCLHVQPSAPVHQCHLLTASAFLQGHVY